MNCKSLLYIVLAILILNTLIIGQNNQSSEMSSQHFFVDYSGFANMCDDESLNSDQVLIHQLGLSNFGRMEGDSFIIGTAVELISERNKSIPESFEFYQNYPNPFNMQTQFRYSLPRSTHVKITIYSILGQHLFTVVDKYQSSGTYEVKYNGIDHTGFLLPTGVYFCRLATKEFDKLIKFAILK